MIAVRKSDPRPRWHHAFLAMLPTIHRCAELAFRDLHSDNRDDAVQEVIANACVAFARLVEQERADKAFPTVLARFAISQVRAGRQVGASLNARDVLSYHAHRKQGFIVERLDRLDWSHSGWIEVIIEDPHTPVFDQVWFRIDFPAWLSQLSRRNREIAEALAIGDSTQLVAKRFGVSAGRISQIRRELYDSWLGFHGELTSQSRDLKNRDVSSRHNGVAHCAG